ncbi:MAG: hypothetical protein IT342_17820 [Candidatus Melainabacteria bacterium]|nr:hypothetical protein [Candidatus Melainabacteria bacterium]
MTQEISPLPDPDTQDATAALIRAAKRARKLAAQTGTEIVVMRDGKMISEFPKMSEFEEETDDLKEQK